MQVNKKLDIQLNNGEIIEFIPDMIHKDLLSLTNNQEVVYRTERLILVQLASYNLIKLHELRMIVYRTLDQLRYHKIASKYYRKELS